MIIIGILIYKEVDMKNICLFIILVVLLVGCLLLVFLVFVKIMLKLSYNQDKSYVVYKVMSYLVDKVKVYLDGELNICIYFNVMLGNECELLELMNFGVL